MSSHNSYRGINPLIITTVSRKAKSFIKEYYYFTESDFDDLQQEFTIVVLNNLDHYNPNKSSLKTFISKIIDNKATDLIRYKKLRYKAELKSDNDQLGQAKRAKSWLEGAMSIKYSTRIKQARTDNEKKTGIVHIEDSGIKISHDIPKKIQWDQKQLSGIVENIAEMGSDPLEYIDISYKVPEHKFISWPKSTQQIFLLARTVRAGNPSYKLSKVDKASEKEAGK